MSDQTRVRTRIRIARGSKEALERMRGSLEDGELFWQKSDLTDDETANIGSTDSVENDGTQ